MWVWRSSRWEACAFLLQVCWSVQAAQEIERPFWRNVKKLCMRLLLRALNLFLSWLVITVSLILRSMHFWIKTHTDSFSLCQIKFQFSTLVDFVSPANCHQPESRAVGHPCNPCNPYGTRYQSGSFSLIMWGVVFTVCVVFLFFLYLMNQPDIFGVASFVAKCLALFPWFF